MSNESYIDEIVKRPYHQVVERDPEGTYSARVLEFDGCFSGGTTAQEAVTNLEEAMRLWLDGEIEQSHPIPAPWGSTEYSGRLNLRLPVSLHEQAALRAAIEGVSLNQLFLTAIARYMGESKQLRPSSESQVIRVPGSHPLHHEMLGTTGGWILVNMGTPSELQAGPLPREQVMPYWRGKAVL